MRVSLERAAIHGSSPPNLLHILFHSRVTDPTTPRPQDRMEKSRSQGKHVDLDQSYEE